MRTFQGFFKFLTCFLPGNSVMPSPGHVTWFEQAPVVTGLYGALNEGPQCRMSILIYMQSYLRQIDSLKYYETVLQFKDINLGIEAHDHHLHQGILLSSYILQYYPMSTYNTNIQRA